MTHVDQCGRDSLTTNPVQPRLYTPALQRGSHLGTRLKLEHRYVMHAGMPLPEAFSIAQLRLYVFCEL